MFQDFSIFISGGHFVQGSRTKSSILVKSIMGSIHVKLSKI